MKFLVHKTVAKALSNYFALNQDREPNPDRDANFVKNTCGYEVGKVWDRMFRAQLRDVFFVSPVGWDKEPSVCDCAKCQIELRMLDAIESADISGMKALEDKSNVLAWFTQMVESFVRMGPENIELVGGILRECIESENVKVTFSVYQIFRRAFYECRQPGIKNHSLEACPKDEEYTKEQPKLRIVCDGPGEMLFGAHAEMRTIAQWTGKVDMTVLLNGARVELTTAPDPAPGATLGQPETMRGNG